MTQEATQGTPGDRLLAWAENQEPPVSQAAMADRLDISRAHLNNVIVGRERPSLPLASRIEDMTGGFVTCREWAPVAPVATPEPATASATR